MSFALITVTSAVILGLLVGEYYRQRRVLKQVGARTGYSRGAFVTHFQERGTDAEVSIAVFDALVGPDLTVDPGDDLSAVYQMDHELFLELLDGIRQRTRLRAEVMDAVWREFGNVSTVRDLVEMIALAYRQDGRHSERPGDLQV